jgi:hypothetical protein
MARHIRVNIPPRSLGSVAATVTVGAVTLLGASVVQAQTPQHSPALAAVLAGAPVPLDLTYEYLIRRHRADSKLPARYRHVLRTADGYLWWTDERSLVRDYGRRYALIGVTDREQRDIRILAFHEDPEGFLLVGTVDGEVIRYVDDGRTVLHRFDTEVHDIATEGDGTVWVALGDGVGRWHDGQASILPVPPGGGTARQVVVDTNGAVWVGTSRGLYHLVDGELEPDRAAFGNGVADLFEDQRGRLWATTPDAIMVRDPDGAFGHYRDRNIPEFPEGGGGPWTGSEERGARGSAPVA